MLTLDTKLIFILYLEVKSKNYIELSNLIDFSLQVTAAIQSLPIFINLTTGWRITRFELLKLPTRVSACYNATWNLTALVITSVR